MEFRDLEIFVQVVRTRSFTRAAERAYLSQPAVSMAVRRLEAELGGELLERRRDGVRPTEAGLILLDHASALLSRRDAAVWEIGRWSGLEGGELRLGTTDAVSVYFLPPVYGAFRERYPRVALRVSVDASGPLAADLLSGALDLAVLTLPAPSPGLITEPVETERLIPVVSPEHPLAGGARRLPARRLSGEVMIGYPRGSVTRGEIDRALDRAGARPRIEMEMGNPEAMKRLVEVGLGFAVLPGNLVADDLERGRLVGLRVSGLKVTRTLGFASAAARTLSPAATAFVNMTHETLGRRAKRNRSSQKAGSAARRDRRSRG